MSRNIHKAKKRRIPKVPGRPKCKFTFEVNGEVIMMKVDCLDTCNGKEMPKDVCWSNLVKAIASSALPDRIVLYRERAMICDRILVSLLRNASLLVRRINIRLDELRKSHDSANIAEVERLSDLLRALLYDIPQLIKRDFRGRSLATKSSECSPNADVCTATADILAKKAMTNLSPLGSAMSERVSS